MKVQLSDKVVEIFIKHDQSPKIECDFYGIPTHFPRAVTTSVVKIGDTEYSGKARCAHGDHFIKRRGVAISLKRALRDTKLGREDRKVIWSKVFSKSK